MSTLETETKFVIKRFVNNISLNGFEYVLDENDKVQEFASAGEALDLLPYETVEEAEADGIYIELDI